MKNIFITKTQQRRKNKTNIPLDDKQCIKCGSRSDLQRHEKSYESNQVEILCRSCHNKLHRIKNRPISGVMKIIKPKKV